MGYAVGNSILGKLNQEGLFRVLEGYPIGTPVFTLHKKAPTPSCGLNLAVSIAGRVNGII